MVADQRGEVPLDDEATFRTLFEAAYDDLLGFVERRTHQLAAEDIVAEVFLTAWRRLDDVPRDLDQARAWLFTVAHHTLRNRRRSDHRQQAVALRILREPGAADSIAEPADVASRIDLNRAWEQLNHDDQQVIALTVLDGLTGPQAATVLGISSTAFSLRLLRARRRLRKHYSGGIAAASPSITTNPGAIR
ncbi:RNA polymerase [Actinoplanes awajinensis subsp. mycoplanecinus]|uniref:RNA polymerase n=1 Tax=Actinoplanes awajinensis subsp. mycoplanecinus TaxID=135947 RepID=A0A117MJW2_9ACTN|nr:RNA polymerase [Actinoplanes awajinensis subsp. mycoplanecinus]